LPTLVLFDVEIIIAARAEAQVATATKSTPKFVPVALEWIVFVSLAAISRVVGHQCWRLGISEAERRPITGL
jgi:hypothetical protein